MKKVARVTDVLAAPDAKLEKALKEWEVQAYADNRVIAEALNEIARTPRAPGGNRRIAWGEALFNLALKNRKLQQAIGRRWLANSCHMAAASWRPRRDHRIE